MFLMFVRHCFITLGATKQSFVCETKMNRKQEKIKKKRKEKKNEYTCGKEKREGLRYKQVLCRRA